MMTCADVSMLASHSCSHFEEFILCCLAICSLDMLKFVVCGPQHTSPVKKDCRLVRVICLQRGKEKHTSAYVSMRQYTSAYASIRKDCL